jgi:hypothetical protein
MVGLDRDIRRLLSNSLMGLLRSISGVVRGLQVVLADGVVPEAMVEKRREGGADTETEVGDRIDIADWEGCKTHFRRSDVWSAPSG